MKNKTMKFDKNLRDFIITPSLVKSLEQIAKEIAVSGNPPFIERLNVLAYDLNGFSGNMAASMSRISDRLSHIENILESRKKHVRRKIERRRK